MPEDPLPDYEPTIDVGALNDGQLGGVYLQTNTSWAHPVGSYIPYYLVENLSNVDIIVHTHPGKPKLKTGDRRRFPGGKSLDHVQIEPSGGAISAGQVFITPAIVHPKRRGLFG